MVKVMHRYWHRVLLVVFLFVFSSFHRFQKTENYLETLPDPERRVCTFSWAKIRSRNPH